MKPESVDESKCRAGPCASISETCWLLLGHTGPSARSLHTPPPPPRREPGAALVTGQVSHNQLSGAPVLLCGLLSSFHSSLSTPPHVYTPIHTSQSSRGLLTVTASGLFSAAIYLPSWADTLVHNCTHTQADHCAEPIQTLPREPGRIRRGRSEDK